MIGMITINLLPLQYRKQERTPLSRFIAILLGIVLVLCAGIFWGYYHYVALKAQQDKVASRTAYRDDKKEEHKLQYKPLAELQSQLASREEDIKRIRKERRGWTRTISYFYDLFAVEEFRPWVWIDDLQVTMKGKGARRPTRGAKQTTRAEVGELKFKLSVAGSDIDRLSDFREALAGTLERVDNPEIHVIGEKFHENMGPLSMPEAQLEESPETNPSQFYDSTVTIPLLELEDPDKEKNPAGNQRRGGGR